MLYKWLYLSLILMVFTPPISANFLRCYDPKITGIGRNCEDRWYFNWLQNRCIRFTYCGPIINGYNFRTLSGCRLCLNARA